jgi:hypothetical protein
MTACNHLGKSLCWLHIFMDILALAFDGHIPVAEDNAATHIIAHTGKLTPSVRHIALKTIPLQTLVHERNTMFQAIGSDANNSADHFTKALPLPAHCDHRCTATLWVFDTSQLIMMLLLLMLLPQQPNTIFHRHYVWLSNFIVFDLFFEGAEMSCSVHLAVANPRTCTRSDIKIEDLTN